MTDAGARRPWTVPALKLAKLPRASEIIVFGSVAKGTDGPHSDIDCLMPDGDGRALWIAQRHYGLFDPFHLEQGILLVRNERATGWDLAKNNCSILRAIRRDGVPLPQIIERIAP